MFCSKYHHAYAERNSQVRFVAKLEQKGQSQVLRRQAQDAVDLYYEMLQLRSFYSEEVEPKKTTLTEESTSDFLQGSTAGTDWRWVYVKLEEQIRVRHYSDRTLKSYRGWTRQWSKHF